MMKAGAEVDVSKDVAKRAKKGNKGSSRVPSEQRGADPLSMAPCWGYLIGYPCLRILTSLKSAAVGFPAWSCSTLEGSHVYLKVVHVLRI